MKLYDVIQKSPKWIQLRLGIPTSSHFHEILTPTRLTMSATAKKYACALISERLIGEPHDAASSKFMQRGSEMEAEAINWYEMRRKIDTQPIGFITDDTHTVGCSPDRLIGDNGGLEIKCCSASVHIENMFDMGVKFRLQVQGCLWITGREWWDVVSYHPHPNVDSVIERVQRDEDCIAKIATAIDQFNDMLQEKFEKVKSTEGN